MGADGSLQDEISPLQTPKEGHELKSPSEPGMPQLTSSGHPLPRTLHGIGATGFFGVHGTHTAPLPSPLQSPVQAGPGRSPCQGSGGFVTLGQQRGWEDQQEPQAAALRACEHRCPEPPSGAEGGNRGTGHQAPTMHTLKLEKLR